MLRLDHLLCTLTGWLLLTATGPALAANCSGTPRQQVATPDDVVAAVRARGLQVLTFTGFSGAGYEDAAAMQTLAARILDGEDPARVLVNAGGTAEGIGAVYALARARGFATLGIVSMLARDEGVALSPCVDLVVFVPDASWGGLDSTTGHLSPTSQAMVQASDRLVAIGGGDIARDELLAARALGRPVVFHPADMQHAAAIDKARRKGLPAPTDFRGAAHLALRPD
jgi:S-adenosylhomocysteine hydrolase